MTELIGAISVLSSIVIAFGTHYAKTVRRVSKLEVDVSTETAKDNERIDQIEKDLKELKEGQIWFAGIYNDNSKEISKAIGDVNVTVARIDERLNNLINE